MLIRGAKGDAGRVCKLLYGCGLRVTEALSLRIKDVDLDGYKVEIRGGKGDKDRDVTLLKTLLPPLREHRAHWSKGIKPTASQVFQASLCLKRWK